MAAIVISRSHGMVFAKARDLMTDSLMDIADAMLDLEDENESLKDRVEELEKLLSDQSA